MAKVLIEFDTDSKLMSCSVDGADVPDVKNVGIYGGYDADKFECEIVSYSYDDASKMRKMTRLMASQSDKAKASLTAPSPFPDFVVESDPRSQLERDIAAYLGRK